VYFNENFTFPSLISSAFVGELYRFQNAWSNNKNYRKKVS